MHSRIFMWVRRALILVMLGSSAVQAAPMGFKDSWMAMGDFGTSWRELATNYAVTPRDAFGMSATYMRSDDELRTRYLAEATYTRLLRRWNLPHAQANLWFMGGLGTLKMYDKESHTQDTKAMASPGIQFDYETTRVYFAAIGRLYRATGVNHDYYSVRAGFSFYETEYENTQPWLIVEARRMHALSDSTEITPMLRFINKNYFIEAGINTSGEPRFNFMYIF